MLNFLHKVFQRLSQMDHIQQAINQGFLTARFSKEGMIEDANENYIHLFGYSDVEELVGEHHQILTSPKTHTSEKYTNFWKELNQGIVQNNVYEQVTKQGDHVWLHAVYFPVKNKTGEVRSIMQMAVDVTETNKNASQATALQETIDKSFAYIQFDPDGQVMDCNFQFADLLGYEGVEEIKGEHHRIFVTEKYRNSSNYQDFWQNLRNGNIQRGEYRRITKSGEIIWIQAAYTPVYEEGEITSVIKIATDITDRMLLSASNEALRKTIDISFGYIRFQPDGTIIEANQNLATLMDYDSPEGFIGQLHAIFVDDSTKKSTQYQNLWNALRSGISQSGEFKRKSRLGKEIWINAAYTPIKNEEGEVVSVVKIAMDITSKRQDEQNKATIRQEVAQSVKEISSAIMQIAEGSRSQAEKTDESSSKLESSLMGAKDVEKYASEINEAASKNNEEAAKGRESIETMVDRMNLLNQLAGDTEQTINNLVSRISEVSTALNLIKDIASQTNLLSLNASIEAAQAGDAGRGFAVVAEEIRKLADDSKSTTDQISQLLQSINHDSESASDAILKMKEEVSQSNGFTLGVKQVFEDIKDKANHSSQLSDHILTAAKDQHGKMNDIVRNVESIVVIAEQTAAGSEQVSAAIQNLEQAVDNI